MMDEIDLFLGTENFQCRGKIAIVGESWGKEEAIAKAPFVGESGKELTRMLQDAGLSRGDCFVTNVCSRRPPDNDMRYFFISSVASKASGEVPLRGLYPDKSTRSDLARLHQQLAVIKPRVIIALGNYALWALTESNFKVGTKGGWKVPSGVSNWRGSYLEWNTWDADGIDPELHTPVIPTFHPAAIMRNWEDRTPAVHDLRARVRPLAQGFAVPRPNYNFVLRPSFQEAMNVFDSIDRLPSGSWITADTETRGETIACLGIAWSGKDAMCVPFATTSGDGSYWPIEEELAIRNRFEGILSSPKFRISNQNINFDRQWWRRFLLISVKPSFDTMVAQHVCWPGTPKSLAYLSSLYCNYHRFWKDDGRQWTIDQDEEILWRYCSIDCVTTWEITQVLSQLVKTLGLSTQFAERMRFLEHALAKMLRGVRIDEKERSRQLLEVLDSQGQTQAYLDRIIPEDWKRIVRGKNSKSEWYSSPAQAAALFYDILGCKEIINKKTKNRTLDDDALLRISQSYPLLSQLCEPLQTLRSLGVIASNFLTARCDDDGRMRSTFDITGTDTFRNSSYENAFWRGTNLQNIPTEKDE